MISDVIDFLWSHWPVLYSCYKQTLMTWIKDGCVALVFNNSQEKPGWQGGKSGVRERLKLLQDFAASPWHLIFATGAFVPTLVKCEERHWRWQYQKSYYFWDTLFSKPKIFCVLVFIISRGNKWIVQHQMYFETETSATAFCSCGEKITF